MNSAGLPVCEGRRGEGLRERGDGLREGLGDGLGVGAPIGRNGTISGALSVVAAAMGRVERWGGRGRWGPTQPSPPGVHAPVAVQL